MRLFVKKMIPEPIAGWTTFAEILNGRVQFAALDRPGQSVRARLGSTVIRVEQYDKGVAPVRVIYLNEGKLYRAHARGVVMANGGWTTQHVVADLPPAYRDAYRE